MRPAREWIKSLGLAAMAVVVQRPAVSAADMNVATSGVLRLTGGAQEALTRSDVWFASDSGEAGKPLPEIELEWQGLILHRGKLRAGVPVDLSLRLIPAFGAKTGAVVVTALGSVAGKLVVHAASGPETWTIAPGNFGSQSARTNFNSAEGTLRLVLPVLLENGKGTVAGVMIAAACSRAGEQWSCSRAAIVFEEMRRLAQPTAGIEAVLPSWTEPAAPAGSSEE